MTPEMLSRSVGALFPSRRVKPPPDQSKVATMPCRLMGLPLEIRRKIYYQVIIDTQLEPLPKRKPSPATAHHCMRRRRPFMNPNTKSLLLANKTINAEVSDVLFFEHHYEIQINPHNVTDDDRVSWQMYLMRHWPSPVHLGKLRNIRICLGVYHWGGYCDAEDKDDADTSRRRCLRLLCNALVKHGHALKYIMLEINCDCQCREWYWNEAIGGVSHRQMNSRGTDAEEKDEELDPAERVNTSDPDWKRCLTPDRFRSLLAPLSVLRGLRHGQLIYDCESIKESSAMITMMQTLCVTQTTEPGEPTSVLLDALYTAMTSKRRRRLDSTITKLVELDLWEAWRIVDDWPDGGFEGLPVEALKTLYRVTGRMTFCFLLMRAEMCGHLSNQVLPSQPKVVEGEVKSTQVVKNPGDWFNGASGLHPAKPPIKRMLSHAEKPQRLVHTSYCYILQPAYMPHAENGSMTEPTVNGDKPSSKFIDHVTSYPAVSDSITAVENNPYGKKAISLTSSLSDNIVSPLAPYTSRPYGYIKPYVQRADELADSSLDRVDSKYPIMKQDSEKLKSSIMDLAFLPFRMANDGKDYVLETYGNEYKKCGDNGYIAGGKAMVTTGLIVTSDSLAWVAEFLNQKTEEGKDVAKQAKQTAIEKGQQAKQIANEKGQQAGNVAKEKKDQAQEKANST
ncbi:MAG: hypothetical protein Q9174_003633 [Haloplaca sp. 1 TL-2023]